MRPRFFKWLRFLFTFKKNRRYELQALIFDEWCFVCSGEQGWVEYQFFCHEREMGCAFDFRVIRIK